MHLRFRQTCLHIIGLVALLFGSLLQSAPHASAATGPNISVNDGQLTEPVNPPSASGSLPFTISLDAASATPISITYQTVNGTATATTPPAAGDDYVAIPTTVVTFAPGETSKSIPVQVNGGTAGDEPDETFTLNILSSTGGTIVKSVGVGTIFDAPSISINDVSVIEGNTGNTAATLTLTLSHSFNNSPITVNYADAAGTATAGTDYVSPCSGTATFPAGATTTTIVCQVIGDTLYEGNETFTVNLSGATPAGATITKSTGTVTIVDDDGPPVLSVSCPATVAEAAGSVTCTVSVTPSGLPTTVQVATADGTAVAPGDYTAQSTTLNFAAASISSSQMITVTIINDVLNEANETFTLNLSAPTNATIAPGLGSSTVTIIDDDAAPTAVIGNATVTEGNTGTTVNAVFTVQLSAPSGQIVTLNYATSNGTATAPGDYLANANVVTFSPGITTQNITIVVNGDNLDEFDETFNVTLSNATNTSISAGLGVGVGTILDDDPPPTATITNASVVEGNSGTTNANFTVTLSTASGKPISIDFATASGTATAGTDYTPATGTLSFAPGETSKAISVPVIGDTLSEDNETFLVNVTVNSSTPGSVTLPTPPQAVGTIIDDDSGPVITVDDVSVVEGNSGSINAVFTVSLSASSGKPVTVQYATADGTATAGKDYTAVGPLTLSFPPGTTTQQVVVPVLGDTLSEDDETFKVNLSSAVNATIGKASGIGTIKDDDAPPVITIGDSSVLEGNTGTNVSASFSINLSQASGRTITVLAQTAPGTATEGTDYRAESRIVTFPPGAIQQNISIVVLGDNIVEPNEDFFVKLSNPVNATLGRDTGEGSIANDDGPSVSIIDTSVNEGNSGNNAMSFQVGVSGATAFPVTVQYATSDGTATAGSDYTATNGTLTFTSNQTQTVTVQITGDTSIEPDETLFVTLSNATNNVTIGRGKGMGTITNDDTPPGISLSCPRIVEGNVGVKNVVCNVVLSSPATNAIPRDDIAAAPDSTITVDYSATNGTATNGTDFIVKSGTLIFTPGTSSQTIPVEIIGDTTPESDETFFVNLSNPVGGTITVGQSVVTIINDDTNGGRLFLPLTMR